MITLTVEQWQELNEMEPVAIDPRTQETYVLVRREQYERLKALLVLDTRASVESAAGQHEAFVHGTGPTLPDSPYRPWLPHNPTYVYDAEPCIGHRCTYVYDREPLVKVSDPLGQRTNMAYDPYCYSLNEMRQPLDPPFSLANMTYDTAPYGPIADEPHTIQVDPIPEDKKGQGVK